jgi:hypothetical protein
MHREQGPLIPLEDGGFMPYRPRWFILTNLPAVLACLSILPAGPAFAQGGTDGEWRRL